MKPFRPALGLASPHLQSSWGPFCRRLDDIDYRETRLPLADGDHVWLYSHGPQLTDGAPCVLLFHGLGGSRLSHYVKGMQQRLNRAGICSIAMDARGSGGRPNDKAYCYHAGSIETIDALINQLRQQFPHSPLFGMGFSLGATQLLNWLIDSRSLQLTAAIGVSAALWLKSSCVTLDRNTFTSRLYRNYLLQGLLNDLNRKREHLLTIDPDEALALSRLPDSRPIRTFFQFDEYINAPLHHFAGADDYYYRCSPGGSLRIINTPTLLIQAKDDPFMAQERQPDSGQLGNVTFETPEQGGHVGFIAGSPLRPRYWAEERALAYIGEFL